MPTGTATLDDLRQMITTNVDQYWDKTHSALLLASLGIKVRRAFPDSDVLMPNGVRSFILEHNVAQIVSHPETPVKIGAIPLNAQVPDDSRELFTSKEGPPRRRHANLAPEFWNAFHLPISGRRFVSIDPSHSNGFAITDLDAGAPTVGQWYEIEEHDLALNDGSAVPELVRRKWIKINAWLSRNKIPIDVFSVPGSLPQRHLVSTQTHLPHDTTIGIFGTLEQQDQARIVVPLDIVVKLLGRHQ